ncbi:hypothetical protein [uncultured Microscilla sp.]|uniref:hypothetical protein n=1 Tax=uncultured Microscilla sp. TaxID=432653 RepID=UPI0026021782|nr:hypothetical protein [uncultured Microscilla sp.]
MFGFDNGDALAINNALEDHGVYETEQQQGEGFKSRLDYFFEQRQKYDGQYTNQIPQRSYTYDALKKQKAKEILVIQAFIFLAGFLVSIYLAHKHDRKFWGYVGYILLGNIGSGTLAWGVALLMVDTGKDIVQVTKNY